ncbi:TlpA disulfide reductase family protein [Mucilaginibacter sp. CAU 1740]|uniref:TlpA family protein disulfide reductase n=1 Tax=Mucilaginibacter sp. CAU 1740 TaxID=3140365 RepID=UPI00325AB569
MLKNILVFLFAMLVAGMANAQKTFNVTIKLDSSINPEKVHYQYYNGYDKVNLPDTFGNKRVVMISDQYYSPFASVSVNYGFNGKGYSSDNFFVDDKPATINLYFKPNNKSLVNYGVTENATPVDSANNKTLVLLNAFITDKSVAKENQEFDNFLNQHKNFYRNDSLTKVFNGFHKRRLNRIMAFIKQYPDDYFSFWYFIDQVAQVNSVLGEDTAYLKEQLTYLKTVFPAKYIGSNEGKRLIQRYEAALMKSLQLNDEAPLFDFTTIDGKKISLKALRGKYVLLDFWATWCPPCLAEIPHVKDIRKKHSAEKLAIIGISRDNDSKKLAAFVKAKQMNWLHIYDKSSDIVQLYGINAIPQLILINKEGKIVYNSNLEGSDENMLSKLLEAIN